MATVNLLPNQDVSNDWDLSTYGTDVYGFIDDDHTGAVATDGHYLGASVAGKTCVFGLEDFNADHSSIDGVRLVLRVGNGSRSQTYDIETELKPAVGSVYYTESTGTENSNRFYLTHTFTNRTTYDGSNAWDNTRVNGLRVSVTLDAHSGGTTNFTYAYVIVTYTPPLVTDNAIFFGCNF